MYLRRYLCGEKKWLKLSLSYSIAYLSGKILCDMFVPLLYTILMLPHQFFLQTQQENSVISNLAVKPHTGHKCTKLSLRFIVNVRLDLLSLKTQKVCQGWQHWCSGHLRCLLYPHLYTTAALFQFLCALGNYKFWYSPWK